MSARLLLGALALLGGCGSSAPPAPAPADPAAPRADPAPQVAPAPPPIAALPLEIARASELPAPATPERALIDRWAAEVAYDLAANARDTYFRARRTEMTLLGDGARVVELSGSNGDSPRPEGGTIHVIERDGTLGATVRAWVGAIHACPAGAAPDPEGALAGCEDLAPTVARALLAHADAGDPVAAVRRLVEEMAVISHPASTLDFVERERDVAGTRVRGERFVPLAATRDATGLSASGTIVVHATCAPRVETYRFELRVEGDTLSLTRILIATQQLTTRCI